MRLDTMIANFIAGPCVKEADGFCEYIDQSAQPTLNHIRKSMNQGKLSSGADLDAECT